MWVGLWLSRKLGVVEVYKLRCFNFLCIWALEELRVRARELVI